jgi:hypothetical protein
MLTLRRMVDVVLPVAWVLGLPALPDSVQAASTLPVVPALDNAIAYLDVSSGPFLAEAAAKARTAVHLLQSRKPFWGPRPPGAVELLVLDPPGGLFVLYNRRKVHQAQRQLKSAQAQLEQQIAQQKLGPSSPQAQALQHVNGAIRDVKNFLALPFLF